MPNAFILPEMSWPEAKEALKRVELAIVPTGSFEQHGPHLTFETDSARAYNFGKLLAARLYPRAILAPPITFGVSYHHMPFPGTITLRPDTFNAVVNDVVWSLAQHGIKQFFLLNGHGGNMASLNVMIVKLRHELGIQVAWASFTSLAKDVLRVKVTSETSGHACEGETSQAMYLAPQIVKRDKITRGTVKGYPYKFLGKGQNFNIGVPYTFAEITDNGALGDATLASEDLGREIVEEALKNAVDFLTDFMNKNGKNDSEKQWQTQTS